MSRSPESESGSVPETQAATMEITQEATMEATQDATRGYYGGHTGGFRGEQGDSSVLNEEGELKLVEFLKDNELLYKRLMDHKDPNKREAVWDKF